jgi:glycosyltransferase involved in cell wall biosynthesis
MTIVGELPPAWLAKEGGEGVEITGAVPDVGPYLERAAVVVAPLDRGAGMRVKVLEALAAGKAVVCTALAAEGLAVRHGEHLLLAEADEDFASAVVRLLSDPDARRRLGERAHLWATHNAGWDRPVAGYCTMYEELLRGSR